MLETIRKHIDGTWNSWSFIVLCILLSACTTPQKEDLFLKEITQIVDAKSISQRVAQEEHKAWIAQRIDSLAQVHNNLSLKQIEQYKHYYNVKIDFLYEYYSGHDLELISDKIEYIFKNYNPAYCSPDLRAHFYNELAHFYASIGLFKEAIAYHEKMEETGADISFSLYQYKHLGNYYYQHKQYPEAIKAYKEKYLKQVEKAYIKTDMLAHMCNNIGLAYSKNMALDSAIFYFEKAKAYWQEFPYSSEERNYLHGIADGNKAEAYMNKGAYKKAIPLLLHEIQESKNYSKSVNHYLTRTRISLATCYLHENQYAQAKEQLLNLQVVIHDEPHVQQKDYYELARKVAQKEGKVEDALALNTKLDELNKLLFEEQNRQDEIEKALRLQTRNVQEQVAQRERSTLQFKRFALIGFLLLLVTMLIVGIFYRKRIHVLREQNDMMRKEIQQILSSNQHKEERPVFTKREEEIIPLLIKKYTNKEISEQLFISVNTVKYHIKNIYNKLKVSSRQEVISILEKEGE